MRHLIFEHIEHRFWLENLLHPLIRQQIQQDISRCQSPYCLIEIPLLTDKKHYPYLNRILLVLAERDEQIKRLLERDRCDMQQALSILSAQADEKTLHTLADDVILNNGTLMTLNDQVGQLHLQYLRASQPL